VGHIIFCEKIEWVISINDSMERGFALWKNSKKIIKHTIVDEITYV